jgi:hypothetical protein
VGLTTNCQRARGIHSASVYRPRCGFWRCGAQRFLSEHRWLLTIVGIRFRGKDSSCIARYAKVTAMRNGLSCEWTGFPQPLADSKSKIVQASAAGMDDVPNISLESALLL